MHQSARRRPLLVLLAVATFALGACNGSSTPVTTASSVTTTTTVNLATETFTGSIGQNGSAVHAFTVKGSGYTLLAGYTSLTPASQTSLGLGIGAWDSTTSTCGLNQQQLDAAKAGSTALSVTAPSGNFCMRAYDGGNIPAGTTVSYTLQIQHY
jgi:hypothetical protein